MNQTDGILKEVSLERFRQNNLWGEQNHDFPLYYTILMEEVGEVANAILENKFGKMDRAHIREELIQVAAVAVAMVECMDRNQP